MFSYRTNRTAHGAASNSQVDEPQVKHETAAVRIVSGQVVAESSDPQFSQEVNTLLSIRAVKERLGVGSTTVWKLIEEERLEKVKLRRRSLITESSVNRLIVKLVEEARRKREAGDE